MSRDFATHDHSESVDYRGDVVACKFPVSSFTTDVTTGMLQYLCVCVCVSVCVCVYVCVCV